MAEEHKLPSTEKVAEALANDPIAKALNRIADALFRQAKAAERAVALQEQMVAASQLMAKNQIDFDRLVSELERRRG